MLRLGVSLIIKTMYVTKIPYIFIHKVCYKDSLQIYTQGMLQRFPTNLYTRYVTKIPYKFIHKVCYKDSLQIYTQGMLQGFPINLYTRYVTKIP